MSSSTIGSPHHFIAECVEKDMAVSFYYIYFIVGFADSEPASFTASFATSVDGNQEIVAAAFYVKCSISNVISQSSLMTMGRTFRLCGATGVMAMVLLCGTMTGPPMLSE